MANTALVIENHRPNGHPVAISQHLLPIESMSYRTQMQFQRRGIRAFLARDLNYAQKMFESALEVSLQLFGCSHQRTGVILLLLSRTHFIKGEVTEAALLKAQGHQVLSRGIKEAPLGGSAGFWSLLGYHDKPTG